MDVLLRNQNVCEASQIWFYLASLGGHAETLLCRLLTVLKSFESLSQKANGNSGSLCGYTVKETKPGDALTCSLCRLVLDEAPTSWRGQPAQNYSAHHGSQEL